MLTGESLPTEASDGIDTYAGALVRWGEAVAEVAATGVHTKIPLMRRVHLPLLIFSFVLCFLRRVWFRKRNFMESLSSIVRAPRNQQDAGGFVYTPREIAQQPESWQGTLDIFTQHQARICGFLERAGLREPLEEKPVVFLIGAGTSDYIGQALALLLRQTWKCEVICCASTELLPNLDSYIVARQKYLWISFSRSGDSPEGVAVLEQTVARYPSIAHLVVTCNPSARMAEICARHERGAVIVLDDAVNDRSLAMTSSFTNMIVMGHCLAHAWSIEVYVPILNRLQTAGETLLLTGFKLAKHLAERRFPRICLVGTGPLAPVAKESALKVLEMSAGLVKTMSETTLGLRHGPMAALDPETLFVCLLSNDVHRRSYGADLLRELGEKQITSARVAIGPALAAEQFATLCEEYLPIEADVEDDYRPVLDVIFGQLLGLCTSMEHGLRPDDPSPGGVINRVVQDFAIYR
jgi:tagatose-6-phosphate ketose/aldose isomerase